MSTWELLKDYFGPKTLGPLYGLAICISFFSVLSLTGIHYGWLPTSDAAPSRYVSTEFDLTVRESGETVFTSVENVSEGLADELLSSTYPSPEAAEHAASPGSPDSFWMRSANAHAVKVCTHSTTGVVSNQTGGGRHVTWFRFHDNGRHYTRTDHQVLTQNGYQTTDTFRYDVSRAYCNC